MTSKPRIGIVGAGIGGLTAALALRSRGFEPVVFEKAGALREVGAGLTINARAAQVLYALGLKAAFETLEPPTPSFGTLDPVSGERLNVEERDLVAYERRYGALTRHVHRADLHGLLCSTLPVDSIFLNHELVDVEVAEDRTGLTFANGQTEIFDLVVACDGLKSVVRQQCFHSDDARFTGFVAWRGLVPAAAVGGEGMDPHFATYASKDRLFARYPVRRGELINYVAIARKPELTRESWQQRAPVADVLAAFENWHPSVRELIAATPREECLCWALYTRPTLERWVTSSIGLLGDAAHPMTPFYGMGAALAIEDGYILARCLEASGSDAAEALTRYQAARLPRGNHLQTISLQRAEAYMGVDPSERSQLPAEGLEDVMAYNPITVSV
ncbi:MAG: FAD-dependent monooxygenase [Pseudomonadota bacterium]